MSLRATETARIFGELRRQARLVTSSAGESSQPQAPGRINAGTMVGGKWVPYGRLGITPLGTPFRLRGE